MEKRSENMTFPSAQSMSPADEAFAIVTDVIEPRLPGESLKGAMRRASRELGMGWRRVKQALYREPAAWRAAEMDAMRQRHRRALEAALAREEAKLAVMRARVAAKVASR